MKSKSSTNFYRYIGVLILALIAPCLCAQPNAPTYFDMEIVQPRAALDKNNRFYRAYPGLLYEVRVAVAGGDYPFTHELLKAPSGMTINKSTGLITWTSPTAQSTSYPVTVKVTDSRGTQKTVDWSILVTTDQFMFVDQAKGKAGATGSINDPVKGFADVYGGTAYEDKYSTKNQGKFVYFKNGRYSLDGYTAGGPKVQWTNRQPVVFLAYPGQNPVIEMSKVAFSAVDTNANNLYVDGFEIDTINTPASSENRMGFRVGSSSNNVTFRKNKFHNMTYTEGSYNQSAIMISRDKVGKYWAFQDNEFYDLHGGYGILGYVAQMVVVEDNYLHDMTRGHGIGPKADTSYWFIRNNRLVNVGDIGIWLYGAATEGVKDAFSNIEISYNYVSSDDLALSVNQRQNPLISNVSIYRNTLVGRVAYFHMNPGVAGYSQQGHFLDGNVIINKQAGGIICNACNSSGISFVGKNLIGTSAANIVDANGALIGEYTKYTNSMGAAGGRTLRPAKVDAKLDAGGK
jgi:hypothetical protein